MFKIDKAFSKANVPKTIRFTEDLDAKLGNLAAGEKISFNELVLRCCQYALEEYDGDIDFENAEKNTND